MQIDSKITKYRWQALVRKIVPTERGTSFQYEDISSTDYNAPHYLTPKCTYIICQNYFIDSSAHTQRYGKRKKKHYKITAVRIIPIRAAMARCETKAQVQHQRSGYILFKREKN